MLLALHLLLKSADVSLPSLLEAAATRGSSGRVVCCKAARSWLWCALLLLVELLVLVLVVGTDRLCRAAHSNADLTATALHGRCAPCELALLSEKLPCVHARQAARP
jgi:hypothetical protein